MIAEEEEEENKENDSDASATLSQIVPPYIAQAVSVNIGEAEAPVELDPDVVVLEGGLAGRGPGDDGPVGPLGHEGDVMVGRAWHGKEDDDGDDGEKG